MDNASNPKQKIYLVDTSAFVEFENFFRPDKWGILWKFLEQKVSEGRVFTIEAVFHELKRKFSNYHVTEWIKNQRLELKKSYTVKHFEYLHNTVLAKCGVVADIDIVESDYADPLLLAVAGFEGWTIITDENKVSVQPNTRPDNLRLPNHCETLNIDCLYGKYAWSKFFDQEGVETELTK